VDLLAVLVGDDRPLCCTRVRSKHNAVLLHGRPNSKSPSRQHTAHSQPAPCLEDDPADRRACLGCARRSHAALLEHRIPVADDQHPSTHTHTHTLSLSLIAQHYTPRHILKVEPAPFRLHGSEWQSREHTHTHRLRSSRIVCFIVDSNDALIFDPGFSVEQAGNERPDTSIAVCSGYSARMHLLVVVAVAAVLVVRQDAHAARLLMSDDNNDAAKWTQQSSSSSGGDGDGENVHQNTSTVAGIVDTAYGFLRSHEMLGTKWGCVFSFGCHWKTVLTRTPSLSLVQVAVSLLPAVARKVRPISVAMG
jgi:hypothetical protein